MSSKGKSGGHKQKMVNSLISFRNDTIYLGWVFLRNEIFNELPSDIKNACYPYVDERQLIIDMQYLESHGHSLSDFFYALITSSIDMVTLDSISYKNKIYFSNDYIQSSIKYPKDPESVTYNLLCDTDKFHFGGVAMRYHDRINDTDDDIIKAFTMIEKFLKAQQKQKIPRILQNIILKIGNDYSLIMLRYTHGDNDSVHYDTKCEIALYQYESLAWKNKCSLYGLLKGIIQIKSIKWNSKWNSKWREILDNVYHRTNHSSKQITIYVDLKTDPYGDQLQSEMSEWGLDDW